MCQPTTLLFWVLVDDVTPTALLRMFVGEDDGRNRRDDDALFWVHVVEVLVGEDDGRNNETTMLCSGCLLVRMVLVGEDDGRNRRDDDACVLGACW